MGILTKKVEVRVNPRNVGYYEDLGYKIPKKRATEINQKKHKKEFVCDFDKMITVKVEDLPDGSNVNVEVLCDFCKKNKVVVPYYRYIMAIKNHGNYSCKECVPKKIRQVTQEKYGVSNVAQLESSKEKAIQTSLERYNVPYYGQTEECHEKMRDTTKNRYGVEHYSQTKEYKEKFHNTCIERYGESYREQFVEKSLNTFREKTGYDFISQSPEVKEKIKQSCLDKFGYEYSLQSPEVREKITQTLYINSSQKASRQQCYINNLYQGILNFPIKYYNVDIYLPNDNFVIEYDGGGHMLNVVTGRETMEEYTQKEIIRNNVIKREGYKQIKIVSYDDKLPRDQIMLQMLSDARKYFSQYPNHSWVEFNIDTSSIRNAEHKEGAPYNYGELRKIK